MKAPWTGFEDLLVLMPYFVDETWDGEFSLASEELTSGKLIWLLQDELMPIATKLLPALGAPYLLAKGVFPRFGFCVAMNAVVYRFAWFGSLAFCVLCYLAKAFCIQLHDSIRDDRYVIGQMLEDFADNA